MIAPIQPCRAMRSCQRPCAISPVETGVGTVPGPIAAPLALPSDRAGAGPVAADAGDKAVSRMPTEIVAGAGRAQPVPAVRRGIAGHL
ncbi:hypothetical protein [Mangrovicoccus algicola]|uniref:Uncharacterized protein n=1 Tax=Mangrovicoccus algicola TaxID=2771008 RepID=A0A8J6YW76_9RHOB|nr:hypothetical protein [Mangrovicoccus algicola]MBE3638882.1 hypothetical protein [Mangrovicoccus algicola]